MPFQHSETTKNKALKLYKDGYSCLKTSKIVGCAVKTMWDWAKESGILRKWKTDPDYHKKYRQRNKERIKKQGKLYRKKNQEKIRERQHCYKRENKQKVNAYERQRRKKNLGLRLSKNISCLIRYSLKESRKGSHWEALVGYSLSELKKHLESLFTENMTWDNYGKGGWHIDHIIPISAFNFDCPDNPDFRRCWSLNNLQPLWEVENLRKNNKIDKHFQPLLKLKPS